MVAAIRPLGTCDQVFGQEAPRGMVDGPGKLIKASEVSIIVRMVTMLNRNAFIIRPTRKFFEWIRSLDGFDEEEEMELEPTIFLIDELASGSGGQSKALGKYWREIAETEFEAWWESQDDWPLLHSVEEFLEYFECRYSEMIHDLSTRELIREEF